jgi:2-isopropylmalate synthase
MQTIDRIAKRRGHLVQYNVEAVTQGRDSLGEVTLKVDFGDGELITGKGASTDVIEASARAYVNAVNRAELLHGRKQAAALAPI